MLDEPLNKLIESNNRLNELELEVQKERNKRNALIKDLRGRKITARKLSDVLGISEQSIHKIVKGER